MSLTPRLTPSRFLARRRTVALALVLYAGAIALAGAADADFDGDADDGVEAASTVVRVSAWWHGLRSRTAARPWLSSSC